MFFARLVAVSLALLLTTTGTGGTKQSTTPRRRMALAGIAEINGSRIAVSGAIGPDIFFEGLRFVDSKDGTDFRNELRPVKSFRQLTVSVTQPSPSMGLLSSMECWIYESVLEDTEVPISDHLIFYVMSPDNTRVLRLSAYI